MIELNIFRIVLILIAGFTAAVIGALPFGLVNLSVIDITIRHGKRPAIMLAHGAATIEVLFGLAAIMAGSIIHDLLKDSLVVRYVIFFVFLFAGFYFFFRRNQAKSFGILKSPGFFKGVVLNLLSLQVLTYWLMAVAFLYSQNILHNDLILYLMFLAGLWLGKMLVLWIYALSGETIFARSKLMARNLNRVMGIILLSISVYYFIKL